MVMYKKKLEGINIGRIYYVHGLTCASYPGSVLVIAAVVVVICSLPFFVTTSGNVNSPKSWQSPWLNYRLPHSSSSDPVSEGEWIIRNKSLMSVRTPQWFIGLPQAIVSQIYIHVDVDCHKHVSLCDMSYYKLSKSTSTLLLDTLHGAERICRPVIHPIVVKFAHFLTSDNKLTVPTSLFLSPLLDSVHQDIISFGKHLPLQSIKELLYGGFWEESHLVKQQEELRLSHRFAVTFVLKPTNENFHQLIDCVEALNGLWPQVKPKKTLTKHFYYEPDWSLGDFAPLLCLYSIVFLYITFSVGKIDLVRSKLGLGFSAVITVVCSLTMSLGICTFFGLSITVSGSEIFPFVVVVIGLENILIITKAVISTDPGLDVKFRIAEGLSKEGRALLYNLLTIVCLVVLGIFSFNYAMKEFCIISLVGLLCDYFLQMVFFATVLSIDLRRMELIDLKFPNHRNSSSAQEMEKRWRIPRREKVNNFLVRGRYAQKFMMVVLFAYLVSVFSQTETFHSIVRSITNSSSQVNSASPLTTSSFTLPKPVASPILTQDDSTTLNLSQYRDNYQWLDSQIKDKYIAFRSNENGFNLWCGEETYCWRPMVTTHLPHLLNYYNITTENKFISVIPPIMLNYRIGFTPQQLFGLTEDERTLLETLIDTLLAFFSLPNVLRGIFLLVTGTLVTLYCIYLAIEAHLLAKNSNKQKSQELQNVFTLSGHKQDIECLSVDGGLVITVGMDSIIHIWDIGLRQESRVIDRREVAELFIQKYRDSISRHIEGCENPDSSSTNSSSILQTDIATSTVTQQQPVSLHPVFTDVPTLSTTQSMTTPSTTSAPPSTSSSISIPIPQKYIPNFFLKRFSMPTILRKSPDKRDTSILTSFQSVESIPEQSEQQTEVPDLTSPLATALPTSAPSPFTLPPYNTGIITVSRPPSSASSSQESTHPSSTYNKPLLSTHEVTSKVKRSQNTELSSNLSFRANESTSLGSQWSVENLSLLSADNISELSYETANTDPPFSPPITYDNGFQFKTHFSILNQFTSDLALEHCEEKVEDIWMDSLPFIWSMDALNGTIAIGCGNGQIEVWSSQTGSLKFFSTPKGTGVTVICVHPIGIVSGHVDGSLQLIGHHGHVIHSITAHTKLISTLTYTSDYIITGSYDSRVKIFRITDFICLRTLSQHKGHITTLISVGTQFCVSGCSSGIVCYWNIVSGQLVHELDCNTYRQGQTAVYVVKVRCTEEHIIALLRDRIVLIWQRSNGHLSNIIEMDGYTHDIEVIDLDHIAIALQIVIYSIQSRHEIHRKKIETLLHVPMIRHLTCLEPSTLICCSGNLLQLVPSGLKMKSD